MNSVEHWNKKWSRDTGDYAQDHEALVEAIKPYLRGEVLDMGCGNAEVGKGIGVRYRGIDYSQAGIDKAKVNCPDSQFVVGDIQMTGFQDRSFDTVLLSAVVEHFRNYHLVLAEAERLCRGRIVVVVPLNSRGAEHYHPHWPMWKCLDVFQGYGEVVEYRQIYKHPRSKACWSLVVIEPV